MLVLRHGFARFAHMIAHASNGATQADRPPTSARGRFAQNEAYKTEYKSATKTRDEKQVGPGGCGGLTMAGGPPMVGGPSQWVGWEMTAPVDWGCPIETGLSSSKWFGDGLWVFWTS